MNIKLFGNSKSNEHKSFNFNEIVKVYWYNDSESNRLTVIFYFHWNDRY